MPSADCQFYKHGCILLFSKKFGNKMSKLTKNALSLKQFMLRQEVLKLYREIFRTIKKVSDKSNRNELKEWARHDFRANQHQTDEVAIKMLLQHGRRSLTELQKSLHLSGCDKTA